MILGADICDRYKPDVIVGDMDSIRKEVLEFYANMVSGALLNFNLLHISQYV